MLNTFYCRYLLGGASANALSHRNTYTSWLVLKRTKHEFVVTQYVNAQPVNVGQGVEDERDKSCRIRQSVRFVF